MMINTIQLAPALFVMIFGIRNINQLKNDFYSNLSNNKKLMELHKLLHKDPYAYRKYYFIINDKIYQNFYVKLKSETT